MGLRHLLAGAGEDDTVGAMTMRPCCESCAAGRPEHVITDAAGRAWRFEMHPFCGPIVLRQDGEPKATQPGSRSPFWPAFDAWNAARNPR